MMGNSGNVSTFGGLIIRFHPHDAPISFQGDAAQVLHAILRQPDRPHSAGRLARALVPLRPTLQEGERSVRRALLKIKKRCPGLLYSAMGGRGWRVASEARVSVVLFKPPAAPLDRKTSHSGSPLARGDWTLAPTQARWRGILLIDLTPRQCLILYHLARRAPAIVPSSELNKHTQLDGRWAPTSNIMGIHLHALKKRLTARGVPTPWHSTTGKHGGTQWVG